MQHLNGSLGTGTGSATGSYFPQGSGSSLINTKHKWLKLKDSGSEEPKRSSGRFSPRNLFTTNSGSNSQPAHKTSSVHNHNQNSPSTNKPRKLSHSEENKLKKNLFKQISELPSLDPQKVDKSINLHIKTVIEGYGNGISKLCDQKIVQTHLKISELTSEIFQNISSNKFWIKWFYSRITQLKAFIEANCTTVKGNKSAWVENLVKLLENIGTKQSFNSKSLKESLELILHANNDPKMQKLLMKIFHPNEEVSIQYLKKIMYWSGLESFQEIIRQVDLSWSHYIDFRLAKNVSLTWIKGDKKFNDTLANMKGLARSYLQGPRINTLEITVNRTTVDTKNLGLGEKKCQKEFFKRLFTMLYQQGVEPEANVSMIEARVKAFLDNEKEDFLGRDLIALGSNGGWWLCDEILRKLYMALNIKKYRLRMQQGTKIHFQVADPTRYGLRTIRSYNVFEAINPEDDESYAIKEGGPLCTLEVHWTAATIPRKSKDAHQKWWLNIRTPKILQGNVNEKQWGEIVRIIKTPLPVEGIEINYPTDFI